MIDVHTHILPSGLPVPGPAARRAGWPVLRESNGTRRVYQNDKLVRTLLPPGWDPGARLSDMDTDGVRVQVLSPIPFTFLYDAEPGIAAELAAWQNDAIAKICAELPERFAGLGTVALQDTERAVAELHRVVNELGLAGVEIGTQMAGTGLHDPVLDPFFSAAERLGAALFVHPGKPLAPERTAHNGLEFGLARPVETALAAGSLVHGGVLARHPRLRVCLAHGGGATAMLAGRWQRGWELLDRPEGLADASPRELLHRLWVDTLTYDPAALSLAAVVFGDRHLLLGTDYPFTVAERPAGAVLSLHQRDLVAKNARAFLRTPALPRSTP
jgi:aminocarboxymuconate-semialdehyde decarboxylase